MTLASELCKCFLSLKAGNRYVENASNQTEMYQCIKGLGRFICLSLTIVSYQFCLWAWLNSICKVDETTNGNLMEIL